MTIVEILVLVVGAYLLGVTRTEHRAHREGREEGYQVGRREGWDAALRGRSVEGKVVEFPRN